MHAISAGVVVVETCGVDEGGVVGAGEEGFGEFAEEGLEEGGGGVDVVVEGGGVAEVGGLWCCDVG